MATATVTLIKGPLSYRKGAYHFLRKRQVKVADAELVASLKKNDNFRVVEEATAKKKKKKAPPPPPVDLEEEEDEEEQEEQEESEEPSEEEEAENTEDDLRQMRKSELLLLADERGVEVQATDKKNQIIKAILKSAKG